MHVLQTEQGVVVDKGNTHRTLFREHVAIVFDVMFELLTHFAGDIRTTVRREFCGATMLGVGRSTTALIGHGNAKASTETLREAFIKSSRGPG